MLFLLLLENISFLVMIGNMVFDKGSFVELINSSILSKGDGPNELVSLTHMSISLSNDKIRSTAPP